MDDLDVALTRLAKASTPPGLEAIEAKVLMRIAVRPTMDAGPGLGAVTILAAVLMGVASAGVPVRAAPAVSLSPLGPSSALALSTLLAGEP